MPSHSDIVADLTNKRNIDTVEYEKVKVIINKLYNCETVIDVEYRGISFEVGLSIEAILKAIKWLFIEQDVTYWNWSGRAMLYSGLKEAGLC